MDRYWEAVEAAAEAAGARIGWGSEGGWRRRGKSNMARSSRALGKALVERLAVPSRRVALRYGERELRLSGDTPPPQPSLFSARAGKFGGRPVDRVGG